MITQLIEHLAETRETLARYQERELELIQLIIDQLGHEHVGQKTYEVEGYKVLVKTSDTYKLEQANLDTSWTPELPIRRSFKYSIRMKEFNEIMERGTDAQKREVSKLITTSPARPSIKVERIA